jgi:hypothetical protein
MTSDFLTEYFRFGDYLKLEPASSDKEARAVDDVHCALLCNAHY